MEVICDTSIQINEADAIVEVVGEYIKRAALRLLQRQAVPCENYYGSTQDKDLAKVYLDRLVTRFNVNHRKSSIDDQGWVGRKQIADPFEKAWRIHVVAFVA